MTHFLRPTAASRGTKQHIDAEAVSQIKKNDWANDAPNHHKWPSGKIIDGRCTMFGAVGFVLMGTGYNHGYDSGKLGYPFNHGSIPRW